MPRWAQISVSLACVAVILACANFTVSRERLRHADLHEWYQRINRDYFDGGLQDARVEWGQLKDASGKTYTQGDSVRIVLDLSENITESRTEETLKHEACHSWTHEEVERTGQDAHGGAFQACMLRFSKESR